MSNAEHIVKLVFDIFRGGYYSYSTYFKSRVQSKYQTETEEPNFAWPGANAKYFITKSGIWRIKVEKDTLLLFFPNG